MAKPKGRLLLIKIGDGAGTEVFTVLCGLITKTVTINNNEYDVTTADCTTPGGALWTEVQGGAKRISITGNGFFKDEAAEARLHTVVSADDPICNFQIIFPDLGTWQGAFFIGSVAFTGEQENGMTFDISLASSGVCTFTAA